MSAPVDPWVVGYKVDGIDYCPPCSPTNDPKLAIWSDQPGPIVFACSVCEEEGAAPEEEEPPVKHGRRCVCPECVEAYLEDQRDGSRGEA